MRRRPPQIADRIWLVGGEGLSAPSDCLCYALDLGALALVDCGVGPGWEAIRANLSAAGLDPSGLAHLLLTHCHIDHAGAAAAIEAETGCEVIAHALDADALEAGDPVRTAASWYGAQLEPVKVTRRVTSAEDAVELPDGALRLLHAPGHTPGSLVAFADVEGPRGAQRILFGQDVHGPLHPDFGSSRDDWQESLGALLDLEADILCEGHHGVIRGRDAVRRFIEGFLEG